LGARTAASFWVFLTLGATDFFCGGSVGLREATLRATAFLGTRRFAIAFFLVAIFLFALTFKDAFALMTLRAAVFCATALFAFGLAVLGVGARRFAQI